MIVSAGPERPAVAALVEQMFDQEVMSYVAVEVRRLESGLYHCILNRARRAPASMEAVGLGYADDVPPGQRRATWLLTEAVNLALTSPEAHTLLHW